MARRAAWQDEILDKVESGVDPAQIDAQLRLTPTERLRTMQRTLESLERARTSDADRFRRVARRPRRP